MKIIKEPLQDILSIIEEDKLINNPIKSIFVLESKIDDGYLLINTLTKEIAYLNMDEYKGMFSNEYLIKHCFLVRENINEIKRVDDLREIYKLSRSKKGITNYTIFLTTECNARCYYCYEINCTKRTMSEETGNKLVDFIIANSKGNKVKLRWFGGEPLLNYKMINLITSKLKESSIQYSSSMISNGYLFNEEIMSFLSSWNLSNVQITLDGSEHNYNRIKSYIYKEETSPFKKVINNIISLLKKNIHVDIRLNLSMNNYSDMKGLISFLNSTFSDERELNVYTYPLFQELENDEHRNFLIKKQKELESLLKDNLRIRKIDLLDRFIFNHCGVDSLDFLTILPDGKLGLCEHYVDSNYIGDLDKGITDLKEMNKLREVEPNFPKCLKCFYYPYCFRLKICNKLHCDEDYLLDKKNKIIEKALERYHNLISGGHNERKEKI